MTPPARVLPTHTPALFDAAVAEAAACLRDGGVVAIPTETVYGLAANAFEAAAVAAVFAAKGRPAHNPVIVHVASLELARRCTQTWPAIAGRLAAAFWPGPLTMVLERSGRIPDLVTAGGATVGIRLPRHPFPQALIRACGFPLAAPSANLSNRLSPTCAEHVRRQLGDAIPLIIDGGPAAMGIESTVLDLTTDPPRLLRPGSVHRPAIEAVVGAVAADSDPPSAADCGPLRSPGQLVRHYAPRARLLVLSWVDDTDLLRQLGAAGAAPGTSHVVVHTRLPACGVGGVSLVPGDADAYARALYAELHRCDEAGAACIVVEAPPNEPQWLAVADRLRRASACPDTPATGRASRASGAATDGGVEPAAAPPAAKPEFRKHPSIGEKPGLE
jgi:L-threonylcarbamoyladenylate synthase